MLEPLTGSREPVQIRATAPLAGPWYREFGGVGTTRNLVPIFVGDGPITGSLDVTPGVFDVLNLAVPEDERLSGLLRVAAP